VSEPSQYQDWDDWTGWQGREWVGRKEMKEKMEKVGKRKAKGKVYFEPEKARERYSMRLCSGCPRRDSLMILLCLTIR
jgi:hypothetical protein